MGSYHDWDFSYQLEGFFRYICLCFALLAFIFLLFFFGLQVDYGNIVVGSICILLGCAYIFSQLFPVRGGPKTVGMQLLLAKQLILSPLIAYIVLIGITNTGLVSQNTRSTAEQHKILNVLFWYRIRKSTQLFSLV